LVVNAPAGVDLRELGRQGDAELGAPLIRQQAWQVFDEEGHTRVPSRMPAARVSVTFRVLTLFLAAPGAGHA
jgi:hypothetical protein